MASKGSRIRNDDSAATLIDLGKVEFQFRVANSVVEEFAQGHTDAAVLRELAQNEYDAGGTRLSVSFDKEQILIEGNGRVIEAAGWRRLSVMLGTGLIGSSGESVLEKTNGLGSKNFGLRSLFLYGDEIYVRSGGWQTALNLQFGTPVDAPVPDPSSERMPGVSIAVPYRKSARNKLEPFDEEREARALSNFVADLSSSLAKLADPSAQKSLSRIEIRSERCNRRLVWHQRATELSYKQGTRIVQRKIRFSDSSFDGSKTKTRTLEEIEYQRVLIVPGELRDQRIPGYFSVPGRRIRLALSLALFKGKVDYNRPGLFYYPLGVAGSYTGTAVSISAPFEMDGDRSQLVPPDNNTWNKWLLMAAADMTIELLKSHWFDAFGGSAYLALKENGTPSIPMYLDGVRAHLKEDPCWPTRARAENVVKPPVFVSASKIVLSSNKTIEDFLTAIAFPKGDRLDEDLAKNNQVTQMLASYEPRTFTVSSLIRLRCAPKEGGVFVTNLKPGEANYHYPNFPGPVKTPDFQLEFANALDNLALTEQHKQDLRSSDTTLAADDSLQAPNKPLWVVDPRIGDYCPVPPSDRLHPSLIASKVIPRLCRKYDSKEWIQDVAQRAQAGTANGEEREALYRYIIAPGSRLDRSTRSILGKAPVLLDHRGEWATPASITLRRARGATQLEPVLSFPHPDYEANKELARVFRFRKSISGLDLVDFARIVSAQPSLAQGLINTLHRFQKLLANKERLALKTIPFLPSSSGGLAAPVSLYLRNEETTNSLSPGAPFVVGQRVELYKSLECLTHPRAADILKHIEDLRPSGTGPNHPEILYPALADAVAREKVIPVLYQTKEIIWNGAGYSKPTDVLMSRKYSSTFLKIIPQLNPQPAVRAAFLRLGVPTEPLPVHWIFLLSWYDEMFGKPGRVLPRDYQKALLSAYSQIKRWPEGLPATAKVLLDTQGYLHSQVDAEDSNYVLDDYPLMADAIQKQGLALAFAQTSSFRPMEVMAFYRSIPVHPLTSVPGEGSPRVGAEMEAPAWYKAEEDLNKINDPIYLSAIEALAASEDLKIPSPSPRRRLRAVRQVTFHDELIEQFHVAGQTVAIPTEVILLPDRLLVADVKNREVLRDRMAVAVAGLFETSARDRRRFANSVFRLLACKGRSGLANLLSQQGVRWRPPKLSDEQSYSDEELVDEEAGSYEEVSAQDPSDDASITSTIGDLLALSISQQFGAGHSAGEGSDLMTEQAAGEDTEEDEENSLGATTSIEPQATLPPLPPIDSVNLEVLTSSGGWSPQEQPSSGSKGGGHSGHHNVISEERALQLGQRGEELVFDHEKKRVKGLGFDTSRVVWQSRINPTSPYDILSVGDDGEPQYLEVKSTTGTDGRFKWEESQLRLAIRERQHYVLCRVYEVDTISPTMKPFRDPAGMIPSGALRLKVRTLTGEVEPQSI